MHQKTKNKTSVKKPRKKVQPIIFKNLLENTFLLYEG